MPNDAAPPAVATKVAQLPAVQDEGEFSMLMDSAKFAQLQRVGTMYARSKMVPAHFQGDEASCMVAVQMAMRMNIDPFMFLQKTYVVGGKPGMEGQMAIALINTRGPFEGPIDWNFKHDKDGKVIEATAFATHKKTGRVCSATLTWDSVVAEGWDKNKKWHSIREQMFAYRTGTFLGRRYCPEVLLGMGVEGEHDEIDVTPGANEALAQPRRTLKDRIAGGVIDGETGAPVRENTRQERARDSDNADKSTTSATETPARRAATPAPGPNASTEQLVESGHIVIHDGEAAGSTISQGAPATAGGTEVAKGAEKTASEPQRGPVMDYEAILRLAKKAKSQDQSDIVLDALNDPAYTHEQRDAVKTILNSKEYAQK